MQLTFTIVVVVVVVLVVVSGSIAALTTTVGFACCLMNSALVTLHVFTLIETVLFNGLILITPSHPWQHSDR